jgi:hypothetical protein
MKTMADTRTPWLAGLAAALLLVAAAPAAGVDKLIPPDSTVVLTVNVKQILDSPLVKKRGLDEAKEALKSSEEAKQVLDELGFDPFRDIDRVTIASPGGADKDRGLLIVRGQFDLDKFKARAEKAARDDPDILKIQKVPGGVVYEVNLPGQDMPFFVSLLNKTTLVVSAGKDYVVDAMDREAGKSKEGVKDKDLRAVLARIDDRQSVSVAAVGAAFKGADAGPAGEFLEKIEALGGGLTVSDELKFEVVLSTRSEDDAKKIKDATTNGVNLAVAALGLAGGDHKEVEVVLDLLKTVKATLKDRTVTIKARVDPDAIKGLLDSDAKDAKDAKDDK